MHETARATWLNTLTECVTLHGGVMSHVTRSKVSTQDHVEVGVSRKHRDLKDLYKIKDYLKLSVLSAFLTLTG